MSTEPVVILGAGWAGLAAAVKLTQLGHKVTLFEAAKQAGGRARTVPFAEHEVDNGQHLLIGAYVECLKLMETVGVDVKTALKRMPLQLTVYDKANENKFILTAPALPAPLHLLFALLTAKGLKLNDRFAAVKFGLYLQLHRYRLRQDVSVKELFKRTGQTEILIRLLWEPLCLSIMNTPIEDASANVFMKVFKDAFTHKRQDADLLLPTVDLANLFPNAAIEYIKKNGGTVYLKSRVEKIDIVNNKITSVTAKINNEIQTIQASNVILSFAPQNLLKITTAHTSLNSLSKQIEQFNYEPIVTVYLQYPTNTQLPQAMIGMSSTLTQWVFDRGSLCQQAGLISVVISCGGKHMTMDDDTLTKIIDDEISILFTSKPVLINSFIIREKRATFACTIKSNQFRPENKTAVNGLYLAGDYTNTHYPSTLEGAVRSGLAAVNLIT